jgi:MtN3 and saliva related transmembrane protein
LQTLLQTPSDARRDGGTISVTINAMQNVQWVGWLSSLILLLTIGKQVVKQWKEQTVKGISKWLFIGQTVAELGFVIYSYLVKDWVFAATNLVLLIENFIGLCIFFRFRKQRRGKSPSLPQLKVVS